MESNTKKSNKKGVFFLIGCVFAIVGGIGLLVNSFASSDNSNVRGDTNEAQNEGIPFPEPPVEPTVFNDPDSELIETFINVNNRNRRFNIFIPGAYHRTNQDVPLVYVWHGFTQSPEVIQEDFQIDQIAESENFIIVYPAGIANNWDIYRINGNSDLAFAGEILTYMKTNFRIKQSSVYSTGYSLGGFMSNLMACAFSNDIAAVAPLAGTFSSGVMEECSPERSVPYMQIHGTRDFVIPLDGNNRYESVDDTLAFWAANNGQQATPEITEVSSGVQLYDFKPDGKVQHYRLIDVTHGQTVPTFPKQTIIDFFKRVSDF